MGTNRAWRSLLVGGLAAAVLVAPAAAQDPFAQLTTRAIESWVPSPGNAATGDVDGDGDPDLLIPSVTGQDHLFLNDGDGVFRDVTTTHLPAALQWSHAATFVDVDGDGDVDLVTAGNSGFSTMGAQNRLLLNDGTGVFTEVTTAQLPVDQDKTIVAVGFDADGDGDADLLCVNTESGFSSNAQNRLYLNDGTGRFADVTATHLPLDPGNAADVGVGDLDGDGDLDFVTALFDPRPLRIHLNDGSGRFSAPPTGSLPLFTGSSSYTVHLVDLEGDGDLDLMAMVGQQLTALVNDGAARFDDQSAARVPTGYGYPFTAGDFDRDGDVDFTVGVAGGWQLLQNDGAGVFGYTAQLPAPGDLACDVDGDGDLDLVLARAFDVLLNDGAGTFFDRLSAERRVPAFAGLPGRGARADVDGDGDLDVWLTSSLVDRDRLLLNDGRGVFADAPQALPLSGKAASVVVLGDVDGDGDQDGVVGATTGPTRLLLGDGAGAFTDVTATHMPGTVRQTLDLVLADFDRDGDLDLVEANYYQSSVLLQNDGSGRFAAAPAGTFPAVGQPVRGAVALDVDGDGDLDLAFANYGAPAALYRNAGTGQFQDVSAAQMPTAPVIAFDLAAADYDGDGDVDLVYFDYGDPPRLYLNTGAGSFVDASAGRLPATVSGVHVHAFDRDGDGDVDLVSGDQNGLHVLDNDGGGTFTEVQAIATTAQPIVAGDLDDDADVDVLLVAEAGSSGVLTNLRRQLHFARLLRPGRDARIDVHAVGRQPGVDFAIPILSAGSGRVPLPGLGVFGLDPTVVVFGPSIPIPPGADVGSFVFHVPAIPGLVGADLFAQGLLVEGVIARLTNTQRERVVQ